MRNQGMRAMDGMTTGQFPPKPVSRKRAAILFAQLNKAVAAMEFRDAKSLLDKKSTRIKLTRR